MNNNYHDFYDDNDDVEELRHRLKQFVHAAFFN